MRESYRIVREDSVEKDYESVPIAFWALSRVDLHELTNSAKIVEIPMEPRWKDYDSVQDERPSSVTRLFNSSAWPVFSARRGDERVGGAVVVWSCSDYDLLDGRNHAAAILDLRVHPECRGQGIGRALMRAIQDWARGFDCREILVETQDINVGACRFYQAMGFTLLSIDENAYPSLDEARIIWRLPLHEAFA